MCLSKLKKARHGLSGYFPLLCFGVVQYDFAFVSCAVGAISKNITTRIRVTYFFFFLCFLLGNLLYPIIHLGL